MLMLKDWQRSFPGCEPIAPRLVAAFPERWVRFHSLPESKRYPENDAETAIVLQRHNSVLGALAAADETLALLTTAYSNTTTPARTQRELAEHDAKAVPWRTLALYKPGEGPSDPRYCHLFISERPWIAATFDPLIRLAANDVLANVLIVPLDCRWLLHPYDGGMDLILDSSASRDGLKDRFGDWLSARPDGL